MDELCAHFLQQFSHRFVATGSPDAMPLLRRNSTAFRPKPLVAPVTSTFISIHCVEKNFVRILS
jgi:hypothetical protein